MLVEDWVMVLRKRFGTRTPGLIDDRSTCDILLAGLTSPETSSVLAAFDSAAWAHSSPIDHLLWRLVGAITPWEYERLVQATTIYILQENEA